MVPPSYKGTSFSRLHPSQNGCVAHARVSKYEDLPSRKWLFGTRPIGIELWPRPAVGKVSGMVDRPKARQVEKRRSHIFKLLLQKDTQKIP
jgi:hypothetical protein